MVAHLRRIHRRSRRYGGGLMSSMLSENAVYLRRLGETVTDVSELMAFELAQAQGYSVLGTLAGGTDAIASGPGIDIAFLAVVR